MKAHLWNERTGKESESKVKCFFKNALRCKSTGDSYKAKRKVGKTKSA